MEKSWIERTRLERQFKSTGKTEGVPEREKDDTNRREKRLKGQIPD